MMAEEIAREIYKPESASKRAKVRYLKLKEKVSSSIKRFLFVS